MSCPADGEIAAGQSSTAGFFEQVENDLAFAERVEEWAEGTEVEAVGAHAHEVTGDAAQFRDDYSQVHGFVRHLHPNELFHGESEPEVHVHGREVVHAVRVGDVLGRAEVFADLFGAVVIEKHFTIDNNLPGRDNKFAILPIELLGLRNYINYINDMMIDHGTGYNELEYDSRTNYAGRFNG